MQIFNEANINISKSPNLIKFVHRNNFDSPENHTLHINSFCEIYIFVSGQADYIVEDVCYTLKPGDIIILTPHEVHKALLKKKDWYERFYFLIPLDAFDYMCIDILGAILNRTAGTKNLISFSNEKRAKAINLLYQISSLTQENDNDIIKLQIYALFLEFLSYINQHILSMSDEIDSKHISGLPILLNQILLYIDQNLTTIESAGKIAKHFNISLPYLSTFFKRNIGTSIKNYIQTRKIAVAKNLLDAGNTVTFTCYESGFNDCSYFIKTFKRHIGLTPLKYQSSLTSGLEIKK